MPVPDRRGALLAPAATIAALLACQPPVATVNPPRVGIVSPLDGDVVNEGLVVTVEVNLQDEDGDAPLTATLAVDGVEAATGQLDDSAGRLTLDTPPLAQGWRQIVVSADDGGGDPREASIKLYVNGKPVAPEITFEPANPTPDDEVRGVLARPATDPDGDPTLTSWAWKRGGETALTGATFPAVLPASLTERGDTWVLEVEVVEADMGLPRPDGLTSVTSAEIQILNDPPTAPTVTILPAAPHPLTPLRCAATGSVDPQGATVSYVWSWSRDRGQGFVDQPAYVDPVLPAAATRAGESWRCSARGSDGDAIGEAGNAEASILADLVTVDAVAVAAPSAAPDRTAPVAVDVDGAPGVDLVLTGLSSGADGEGRIDGLLPATLAAWRSGDVYADGDVVLTRVGGAGTGSSLTSIADVSRDGLPDLAIGVGDGEIWLVASSALPLSGGLDLAPLALQIHGAAGWTRSVLAGDAFGSPRAELFIPWLPGDGSAVIAVAPGDLVALPGVIDASTLLASAAPDDGAGAWGTSFDVGDLNQDGTADLAVGVPRAGADRRCAAVFSAGQFSTGEPIPEMDALVTVLADAGEGCGRLVRFLPDLDGDGDQELAVSLPDWQAEKGRVAIFAGGARVQIDVDVAAGDPALILEGQNPDDAFGGLILPLGDVAIGAPKVRHDNGRLYVYSGAALGAAMATATAGTPAVLRGVDAAWRLDGDGVEPIATMAGLGDIDGDGFTDLVVHGASGTSWYLFSGR